MNDATPLWEGANISCVPLVGSSLSGRQPIQRQSFPRRPTIRFFIPHGVNKPNFESAVKMLEMQNKPMVTNNWIAWKAEEKGDGTFYHVSVDESDIDFIKSKSGRFFYCFTKIKINLPKEPMENGNNGGNDNGNERLINKFRFLRASNLLNLFFALPISYLPLLILTAIYAT